MYRLLLFIFALQFIVLTSYAQQRGQLPNVAITQNKNTVELKWFCQYEGVHAISIEIIKELENPIQVIKANKFLPILTLYVVVIGIEFN